MNTTTLARLAQRIADQLEALHASHEEGLIDRQDFVALAVALLAGARARATALADLALAAELTRLRKQIVLPIGIEPPAPLAPAVVTETLDSPQYALAAAGAVAVLARAVTLEAAQEATHTAMEAHVVSEWTRDTEPGACEICEDLAGQGPAPATTPMWWHRGCGCAQRPVA